MWLTMYTTYVHIELKKKCLPYQRNIWEEKFRRNQCHKIVLYILPALWSHLDVNFMHEARWSHLLFCFNFQAPCLTIWIAAFHEDDNVLIYDMTIFVAALKILCGKKIRDRSFSLALAIWRSKLPYGPSSAMFKLTWLTKRNFNHVNWFFNPISFT